MTTFVFYSLNTGKIHDRQDFDSPMDAYEYRQWLQRDTGCELFSLVPTDDPAADQAHIRLMVDRHLMQEEMAR